MSLQDSALAAIMKLVEDRERELGIVRIPAPRSWVPCNFCGGGLMDGPGCMACFNARQKKKTELEAEYQAAFPNGPPEPIFTANRDNPAEMESARRAIGREAIEKAFGPDGGGVEEIVKNCETEMKLRKENATS